MKNKKGITLIALTIYVIAFSIIIGIIATLTSYFYNNVINFDETTKSYAEINKFNMYFLQDIKEDGVSITNFLEDENKEKIGITLYNSKSYETNIYKFENNAIYRNGNLICKNINSLKFKIDENNKNIINIYIETQGAIVQNRTMTYTLKS